MERVAIVGAGLIGRAWAIVFARAGHEVSIHDAEAKALDRGLQAIESGLADLQRAGLLGDPAREVRARIRPASLEDALDGAAYVQESVRETLEAKREIFGRIDRIAPAGAILASSTSTIPASQFSEGLPGRARCLVAHPVNPPHLVPLVELAPAPWTSAEALERARALLEAAGQVPILVRKEIGGFILNRLQAALLCEAMRLYEGGYASAEDIDKCVRDGLGLRWSFMGPFETIDLNAPGGVVDYAARYGAMLCELGRSAPWQAETVARLEADRRRQLPAEELEARAAWRDRRLMEERAWRHRNPG